MDIDNTQDIINSREILERIEELEELETAVEEAREAVADAEAALAEAQKDLDAAYSDYGRVEDDELATLRDLADQCQGYGDWEHGEALIRESYFKDYAEQLAYDIGAIDRSATWPLDCIDWDRAAEELKADYMEVDYTGVVYFIRA